MQTIRISIDNILSVIDDISLCLGYFDGLHLGHKKLIQRAVNSKYKSALLTFKFNNINLKNKKKLTSLLDKEMILDSLGLDYLFVLDFDFQVKELEPKEFIERIILKLNVKELVVGKDFTFGKNALGNVDFLKSYFSKYNVIVIDDYLFNNKKVSTSNIIKEIENGKIENANLMLGYHYSISSQVKKGFCLGNKIGYPTANIELNDYVVPKNGVYLSRIIIDNKNYFGMSNIGYHPTINELNKPLLEVYIFDFNENIYEKNIKVELIKYIRDEKKFNSVDELLKQLSFDEFECRKLIK